MSIKNEKRQLSAAKRKKRMVSKLAQLSRVERLRAIMEMARNKEQATAFDLAVRFGVSPNVIYRDIKELREANVLPKDWELAKRPRLSAVEML